MFGKKKKQPSHTFDPSRQKAVIKCSICTGEQVAGFKDRNTGKFDEVMLIRNDRDLEQFRQTYGVTEVTKEY